MSNQPSWWRTIADRYDETKLIKSVFFGMVTGVIITLVIDYRELRAMQALAVPAFDRSAPVLPAALPDDASPAQSRPDTVTTPAAAHRAPMTMELEPGGVLRLRGAIGVETAGQFAAEVERIAEYVTTVSLDSPGGALESALAMGRLIRERGFATRVDDGALCASACPLVFAGGVERMVEPDAAFGLHQIFSVDTSPTSPAAAMAGAQSTTARINRYLDDMGVDPVVWLHALETPPARLYYLNGTQLADYRMVTPG